MWDKLSRLVHKLSSRYFPRQLTVVVVVVEAWSVTAGRQLEMSTTGMSGLSADRKTTEKWRKTKGRQLLCRRCCFSLQQTGLLPQTRYDPMRRYVPVNKTQACQRQGKLHRTLASQGITVFQVIPKSKHRKSILAKKTNNSSTVIFGWSKYEMFDFFFHWNRRRGNLALMKRLSRLFFFF